MKITNHRQQQPETPAAAREIQTHRASVLRGARGAIKFASKRAASGFERMPAAMRATRTGAREATTALQGLPESTLRWLTAGAVGLAAGFQLAGAPRLVRAAGAAPALFMGAAMALRPSERVGPVHDHAEKPLAGASYD